LTNTITSLEKLKTWLVGEALALGFDLCRITGPDVIADAPKRLANYINEGRHGSMAWMEETIERRSSPRALWSDANSIIMLGMNYGPEHDPLAVHHHPENGAISVYAQNRDYHDVMKGKLKTLAGKLASRGQCDVKVFVDTAPVMEKPLAQAAGMGWQGKHSNLVSPELGSWFFIGSIFTTAKLPLDEKQKDHCGSCRACLDACPTNAFSAPYQVDARRCISYLTIENKGPIPREFRKAMGNRIYGCDDCLTVCPWNKYAKSASEAKLVARDDLIAPALAELSKLDDADFRKLFSANPVKRIGRDRFMRNVLIALGNSGDSDLTNSITPHLEDGNPLVRGAAIWALSQLDRAKTLELAKKALTVEKDASVLQEWRMVQ
jgi:epoxyqueuosine reductase